MVDAGKLLGNLELHSNRPCASTQAKPVGDIMKLDARPEAVINDILHDIT